MFFNWVSSRLVGLGSLCCNSTVRLVVEEYQFNLASETLSFFNQFFKRTNGKRIISYFVHSGGGLSRDLVTANAFLGFFGKPGRYRSSEDLKFVTVEEKRVPIQVSSSRPISLIVANEAARCIQFYVPSAESWPMKASQIFREVCEPGWMTRVAEAAHLVVSSVWREHSSKLNGLKPSKNASNSQINQSEMFSNYQSLFPLKF